MAGGGWRVLLADGVGGYEALKRVVVSTRCHVIYARTYFPPPHIHFWPSLEPLPYDLLSVWCVELNE